MGSDKEQLPLLQSTEYGTLPSKLDTERLLSEASLQLQNKSGSRLKRYNFSLWIMYLATFIDMVGFGLLIPLLPFDCLVKCKGGVCPDGVDSCDGDNQRDDYSFLYGVVNGSFSAGQFLGSVILGGLSDRYGRKPVLLLGLAGTGAFFILTGLATNMWVLILARFLSGLFAGTGGTCGSYIADVTNDEERKKYMGILGAVYGAGIVFGPGAGSVIALFAKSKGVEYSCFVKLEECEDVFKVRYELGFMTLYEPIEFKKENDDRHIIRKVWDLLMQPQLLLLFLGNFFFQFLFAMMETSIPLLGAARYDFKASLTGLVLVGYGVDLIVVQAFAFPRAADRFGVKTMSIYGALFTGIFALTLPFCPNIWTALIALAGLGASNGFFVPGVSVIASVVAGEQFGIVLGTMRGFSSLARTFSPAIAGYLFGLEVPNVHLALTSYDFGTELLDDPQCNVSSIVGSPLMPGDSVNVTIDGENHLYSAPIWKVSIDVEYYVVFWTATACSILTVLTFLPLRVSDEDIQKARGKKGANEVGEDDGDGGILGSAAQITIPSATNSMKYSTASLKYARETGMQESGGGSVSGSYKNYNNLSIN